MEWISFRMIYIYKIMVSIYKNKAEGGMMAWWGCDWGSAWAGEESCVGAFCVVLESIGMAFVALIAAVSVLCAAKKKVGLAPLLQRWFRSLHLQCSLKALLWKCRPVCVWHLWFKCKTVVLHNTGTFELIFSKVGLTLRINQWIILLAKVNEQWVL